MRGLTAEESHCNGDERIARPREEPVNRRGVDQSRELATSAHTKLPHFITVI